MLVLLGWAVAGVDGAKRHLKRAPPPLSQTPPLLAQSKSERCHRCNAEFPPFPTLPPLPQLSPPGAADEAAFVRILDDTTFDVVASYALQPSEMGCSLTSVQFADDPAHYYVVGTAFLSEEELEPSRGRLLVLQYAEGGKLQVGGCAVGVWGRCGGIAAAVMFEWQVRLLRVCGCSKHDGKARDGAGGGCCT